MRQPFPSPLPDLYGTFISCGGFMYGEEGMNTVV